ncbi:MAG: peptidoglycan DD-metalloendopeptidase family protein [Pyrinomonadaceae bacterium]|nr:peptidoglycan DD-metalloendopeptidase family protein [Pyrinomonadaceae bacterium]
MYRQMFSEQIAITMAKNGGIGMADILMKQLNAKREASSLQKPGAEDFQHKAANEHKAADGVQHPSARSSAAQPGPLGASGDVAMIVRPAATSEAGELARATGNKSLERAISTARFIRSEDSEAYRANAAGHLPDASLPPGKEPFVHVERLTSTLDKLPVDVPAAELNSLHPIQPISMQLPVQGRITSQFGTRRDPLNGSHKHHQGMDIAAPLGTPIGAAATGTVIFAGRQGGYGNTVVIEHADGKRTRYAHAQQLYVTPGDHVRGGQTIATVGSTGRSTGPHLHFEVLENNQHIDPLSTLANDSTLARR